MDKARRLNEDSRRNPPSSCQIFNPEMYSGDLKQIGRGVGATAKRRRGSVPATVREYHAQAAFRTNRAKNNVRRSLLLFECT
jgi:hypothetical protein